LDRPLIFRKEQPKTPRVEKGVNCIAAVRKRRSDAAKEIAGIKTVGYFLVFWLIVAATVTVEWIAAWLNTVVGTRQTAN